MSDEYIVELEPGVWLTSGDGDHRTLKRDNAEVFPRLIDAASALRKARELRPFANACIAEKGFSHE